MRLLTALLAALVAGAAAQHERPPFYPLDPTRNPWEQLKDRHAGERCLYIGNGPSLNKVDFEKHVKPAFNVVMGVNKIYMGFERFNFRPNYFAAANAKVLVQSAAEFLAMPKGMVKFVRSDRWEHDELTNQQNNIVTFRSISKCEDGGLTCKVLGEDMPSACLRNCNNCFCDASQYVVEGNTITYISLQILSFMGCKDVVIVGVDHSFKQEGKPNSAQLMDGPDPNHFDPAYFGGQKWDLADLESSERHYHIAKAHFTEHCGQVMDATAGGLLTIFHKYQLADVAPPHTTLWTVLPELTTLESVHNQAMALRSWRRLQPQVRVVVLATSAVGATLATKLGFEVHSADDFEELRGRYALERQVTTLNDLITADAPTMVCFLAHSLTVLRRDAVQTLTKSAEAHTVAVANLLYARDEKGVAAAGSALATAGPPRGKCGIEDDRGVDAIFRANEGGPSAQLQLRRAGSVRLIEAGIVLYAASAELNFAGYQRHGSDGQWLVRELQEMGAVPFKIKDGTVPAFAISATDQVDFIDHDASCLAALLLLTLVSVAVVVWLLIKQRPWLVENLKKRVL